MLLQALLFPVLYEALGSRALVMPVQAEPVRKPTSKLQQTPNFVVVPQFAMLTGFLLQVFLPDAAHMGSPTPYDSSVEYLKNEFRQTKAQLRESAGTFSYNQNPCERAVSSSDYKSCFFQVTA